MTAKSTPARTTVRRMVAIVSLTTAISGVMLASSNVSIPVAGAATHATVAAAPALPCGPDCPWDGIHS